MKPAEKLLLVGIYTKSFNVYSPCHMLILYKKNSLHSLISTLDGNISIVYWMTVLLNKIVACLSISASECQDVELLMLA